MDALSLFGLFAVTLMLVCYTVEDRPWFVLAFAGACALASTYGFLQGAWPFGLIEAVWALIAVCHWWLMKDRRMEMKTPVELSPNDSAARRIASQN